MRKKTQMKLGAILATAALLLAGGGISALTLSESTALAETTPTLSFKAANVAFEDGVHLMYAVKMENVEAADVDVLVWTEAPTEYTKDTATTVLKYDGSSSVTISEVDYPVYYYEELAAKQMTDVIYTCAYAEVNGVSYYSEPIKYSVLQYAYNKLGKTDATPTEDTALSELLETMLQYGALSQKYLNYKIDRLADADYTFIRLSNASLEDGFNYGLYLPGESLTVTPDAGYKLSVNAGSAFSTDDEGTITLTVPSGNLIATDRFVEESVEEEVGPEPVEVTYTMSDYEAGTQYADNEEHVLDDNVTLITTDCHFTTELRIYSSSTNDGYAIIASKGVIDSITLNAGNKVDTLNVYGSVDGNEYTLIEAVAITATSYNDYEVTVDKANGYKYLKLDVAGTNQVRIQAFTLSAIPLTDAEKVGAIAASYALDFTQIEGADSKELPTEANGATIAWALTEHANAELSGNVLTTTNPEEDTTITLTATFTLNEATATASYQILLLNQLSDEDRLTNAASELELGFTTISGAAIHELPVSLASDEEISISWTLTEHANATLEDNVLTTSNPEAETTLTLTAALSLNGKETEKEFTVALTPGSAVIVTTLATFEFGDDVDTSTHKDGSDIGTSKDFTSGDYTLSLTEASKVSDGANDATGKSCLKLGTSSVVGSFVFTVSDEVTKVKIYVAGYKANTAQISVNGGDTQTISTCSNNGEYTEIEVDTTTNKTVSFTTVASGYRVMIDKIVFMGTVA